MNKGKIKYINKILVFCFLLLLTSCSARYSSETIYAGYDGFNGGGVCEKMFHVARKSTNEFATYRCMVYGKNSVDEKIEDYGLIEISYWESINKAGVDKYKENEIKVFQCHVKDDLYECNPPTFGETSFDSLRTTILALESMNEKDNFNK